MTRPRYAYTYVAKPVSRGWVYNILAAFTVIVTAICCCGG